MHRKIVLPAILVSDRGGRRSSRSSCPSPSAARRGRRSPASPAYTEALTSKALPPAAAEVRRRDQGDCGRSPRRGGRRRSCRPRARPNVLLIMLDDAGYGSEGTFGGTIPTPTLDRIAQTGLRYTHVPLGGALLADPGRADHRSQPSLGALRHRRRGRDRLSRLRHHRQEGHRHRRRDPAPERLRDVVVRQEPQRGRLARDPGRTVRPVAGRHGLRLLLRLRRRRLEPVAAEPLPQHDVDRALRGQPVVEPHHRDGRRGDRLHEPAERGRAGQAVLRLLRAGRHARARITRPRSGSRSSRASSTTAGTRSASGSSRTRSGSA